MEIITNWIQRIKFRRKNKKIWKKQFLLLKYYSRNSGFDSFML